MEGALLQFQLGVQDQVEKNGVFKRGRSHGRGCGLGTPDRDDGSLNPHRKHARVRPIIEELEDSEDGAVGPSSQSSPCIGQ